MEDNKLLAIKLSLQHNLRNMVYKYMLTSNNNNTAHSPSVSNDSLCYFVCG